MAELMEPPEVTVTAVAEAALAETALAEMALAEMALAETLETELVELADEAVEPVAEFVVVVEVTGLVTEFVVVVALETEETVVES